MYRGEESRTVYSGETYMPCGGGVLRVSLKCFLWGSMPLRKGAWYSFGVLKDRDKFAFLIGEECIGGRIRNSI